MAEGHDPVLEDEALPLSTRRSSARASVASARKCYGSLTERELEIAQEAGLAGAYDIESVVTWRVFSVWKGTIIVNWSLWKETGVTAVLYWFIFIPMYVWRPKNFSDFVGKEASIRAFIAMFSTLIGLLLSFYTALNLNRWWQMRICVQHIQEGTKNLTYMISQGVTTDAVLLDTIHRYGRASLLLVFAATQFDQNVQNEEEKESPRHKALRLGLLTEEEVDKLELCNPHKAFIHAETLWVWLANVVTRLHDNGLTKGPPHYCQLMAAVEEGRSGVAEVQTFLETPIPLGYVHLLCLMVKLHNFILTVLMALASVMNAGGAAGFDTIGVLRTAFRAFFMPFLYNAILSLNREVVNPFGSDAADFSFENHSINMLMNSKSFSKAAGRNLPDVLSGRGFEPWKKASDSEA